MLLFRAHLCTTYTCRTHGGQKREPNPLELDGCYPPYGCWELSLNPLEGQPVLLITELWLQLLELLCLVSKFDTLTNCSLYILAQIPGYVFRIDPGHENCISTGMDTQG